MPGAVDVKQLSWLLTARKLTREDFARLAGYEPATVAAYLDGRRPAPDAFAVVAEQVLKLKPGQLRANALLG